MINEIDYHTAITGNTDRLNTRRLIQGDYTDRLTTGRLTFKYDYHMSITGVVKNRSMMAGVRKLFTRLIIVRSVIFIGPSLLQVLSFTPAQLLRA